MRVFWRGSLSVSFGGAAMLAAIAGVAPRPAAAAPTIPKASWNACFKDFGPNLQCATVQVPLDHDGPANAAISIAMVRLPAGDPARRIGSLFVNPGGPGGSGVEFARLAGQFLFTPEVRARFDIVGFDPRGIARSTALRCFGNPRQWTPYFTPFAFPIKRGTAISGRHPTDGLLVIAVSCGSLYRRLALSGVAPIVAGTRARRSDSEGASRPSTGSASVAASVGNRPNAPVTCYYGRTFHRRHT